MILSIALAASAALAAPAANPAGLTNGQPPRPCLGCNGGPPMTNGPALNGANLKWLGGSQHSHAGGAVCSKITNACWINNGVALNGRASSTAQLLEPVAVRLADGTLVQISSLEQGDQ